MLTKIGICTKCASSMQATKINRLETSYWCPRCRLGAYQHMPRNMTVREMVAE